jgi:hypothetical protein
MRYSAMVIGGFIVLLIVFSRRYLKPYDSLGGQAVLVFIGLYWGFGFWWMKRMGREEAVERVLNLPTVDKVAV